MGFRKTVLIRVALAAGLVLSGELTASAQGPGRGRGGSPEPYTPAADAKDLKAVLFNWMRYMDVLKGHDERDMVATLEYTGTSTIQVQGQPCALTKYRASTNYQTFSLGGDEIRQFELHLLKQEIGKTPGEHIEDSGISDSGGFGM